MNDDFQYVGRVKAIMRYPVKSMRGESLQQAGIYWYGIEGDRRYAFVKSASMNGFPWLTGRDVPEMLLYTPRFLDTANVKESPVDVMTPSGATLPLDSPELLAELTKRSERTIHLIHLSTGCHDAMTLSFLSTTTAEALGQEAGLSLDPRRFRPNLLVELADGSPFGEERWIGSTVQIGEGDRAVRIRVDRRNVRCAMTNIDPDTAERDPRVLKTIVRLRDECAAVYGTAERPGAVRVDDPIYQWTM